MENKKLKQDGAYGAHINGYDSYEAPRGFAAGADHKKQFLNDARALLKDVSRLLAKSGLTEADIRINPGGPAVSGDAYADFWSVDTPEETLYVSIGASAVIGDRTDGLSIYYRTHKRANESRGKKPDWRIVQMGTNNWISANATSTEIAHALLKLIGKTDMTAEGESEEVRQFTAAAQRKAASATVGSFQMALF